MSRVLECFCLGKGGPEGPCGDAVYAGEAYKAVIDGATPKGKLSWEGLQGDEWAAAVLVRALEMLPREADGIEALHLLDGALRRACLRLGRDPVELPPLERPQASILLYSEYRQEVWSYGDCRVRIANRNLDFERRGDRLLSKLRVLYTERDRLKGIHYPPGEDPAREALLGLYEPYLRQANMEGPFGYPALNGAGVCNEMLVCLKVLEGQRVVLATDGYPKLYDERMKAEAYLQKALAEDPNGLYVLSSTKGLGKGAVSYDDRAWLSFIAESREEQRIFHGFVKNAEKDPDEGADLS